MYKEGNENLSIFLFFFAFNQLRVAALGSLSLFSAMLTLSRWEEDNYTDKEEKENLSVCLFILRI